jgi:hypothetical protein
LDESYESLKLDGVTVSADRTNVMVRITEEGSGLEETTKQLISAMGIPHV